MALYHQIADSDNPTSLASSFEGTKIEVTTKEGEVVHASKCLLSSDGTETHAAARLFLDAYPRPAMTFNFPRFKVWHKSASNLFLFCRI